MEERQKLIEAINNGKGYEYISNHYTQFSKEELKDIALELFYELETAQEKNTAPFIENVVEELKDRWS